jgi:RNA polymerase sigma-70 factor (ECF subfamily)
MLTHTTTALLEGLADPADEETWRAFDARFRPMLNGFARRLGLAPEDAADAAQETLTRFVRAYRAGKYDRNRGRLRAWIIGIARHCIIDLKQSRAARAKERGLSAVAELPDDTTLTELWDTECEQEILRQGLDELRRETKTDARTLRAFEMVAFDGRRPAEVAQELAITTNDVYLAKHRCLKRLRAIINQLDELYEVT